MIKNRDTLWYRQEADVWLEALPIGNGRIGAMVFGRTLEEQIQIDESTFWSGEPSENNNTSDSRELLDKLRKLLLNKEFEEADRLGHNFVGRKNNYGTNMPVANLSLKMKGFDKDKVAYGYRSLDMADAVAETAFDYDGAAFRREVFVSNPDQVVCVRFSNEMQKNFAMEIRYDGIENDTQISGWDGSYYLVKGNAFETLHSNGKCGAHLEGVIGVLTDGTHRFENHAIVLDGATEVTLMIDLQTDMFQAQPLDLARKNVGNAVQKGYEELKTRHIRDVRNLYERMDLVLGDLDHAEIPTDERIRKASEGEQDPALFAQMFQYGRYLLIASSREDSPLPTHMGGIWNDTIYTNSDCTQDMHIDMNLEMQYWLAAQCNLAELYKPLFRYIADILVPSGTKAAKETYGAKGWTAHIVTNPWGFTSLGWSYNWGSWSLGGVWCTTLLWDYYEYTLDKKFLRDFAYPIIEGAARFVLDYVFYDETSRFYMTGPSYSPENMFETDGKAYFLSLSNTCDVLMVREMLSIMLKTLDALEIEDKELASQCHEVMDKLPPYQIGSRGQLQEWFYDFDEPIPNHRHTSHLLGMYPFSQIKPDEMPELAAAVRKSIECRYRDFEITSWGMAMIISLYARLSDGKAALEVLKDTYKTIVKPNMVSVMSDEESMWHSTWELDGNTGLTSAIGEMLLQSQDEVIRILPAIPEEWKSGKVKGISIRGGHEADIDWKEGEQTRIVIRSGQDGRKTLIYKEQKIDLTLKAGESIVVTV